MTEKWQDLDCDHKKTFKKLFGMVADLRKQVTLLQKLEKLQDGSLEQLYKDNSNLRQLISQKQTVRPSYISPYKFEFP